MQVSLFLEDLPVFGPLDQSQLLGLARLVRTCKHEAGSTIFKQGCDCDDVRIIRTGFVRLLRDVDVDPTSRGRINQATRTLAATSRNIDALITPRGPPLPKLKIEVRGRAGLLVLVLGISAPF